MNNETLGWIITVGLLISAVAIRAVYLARTDKTVSNKKLL